ncbi:MAG: tRNA (guanosine(46)-N7)-methyltransferase TrmB [Holosporales bacterium]
MSAQGKTVHEGEGTTQKTDTRFYGRRKGRPIVGYRASLMAEVLPQLVVPLDDADVLDLPSLFPSSPRYALEIGFGGGEHLAARAQQKPEVGFIGAEAFVNGVASLVRHVHEGGMKNVRIHHGDVRNLLPKIADQVLDELYVLFPDPWPKTRHHERRLLRPEILRHFLRMLKKSGRWYFATDHADYLVWALEQIQQVPEFRLVMRSAVRPEDWPPTRYEAKAMAAGRPCTYFVFERSTV